MINSKVLNLMDPFTFGASAIKPRLFVRGFIAALNKTLPMDYEHVVQTINSFQNYNPAFHVIDNKQSMRKDLVKLNVMYNYLERTGVTKKNLNELSIIHVTGTKGKGSTSAFCESILRAHGYRTGFYSSPHLVTVRERIRINGKIMDKELFMTHFNDVYSKLMMSQKHENDMPGYFCFLTVLAFNVFLKEPIDVVILEVGIGGLLDYTNVVRNVPSVGISSLGLDHMDVLGDTIEEIAHEKAGIMKPGCTAFTVEQPINAHAVLESVAEEIKCPLYTVPSFDAYIWENNQKPKLSVNLPEYKTNASLAIQLAHSWMKQNKPHRTNGNHIIHHENHYDNDISNTLKHVNGHGELIFNGNGHTESETALTTYLPMQTADGLTSCFWPGRFQMIRSDYANFFLDGAHTPESIAACIKWFKEYSSSSQQIMVFNTTGARSSEPLLQLLSAINFKKVFFCPNFATNDIDPKNEQFTMINKESQLQRCEKHSVLWRKLNNSTVHSKHPNEFIYNNLSEVLGYLKQDFLRTKLKCDVLVTGSLHLIGAAIVLLDPKMSADL